jgi:hypothetical protein
MTLEDKIKTYQELKEKIELLEEQKKTLVSEILQLMPLEQKSIRVDAFTVKKAMRLNIKISVDNARIIGAVKTQEVVDREKIKKLYELGEYLPDVSEIHFIQVYSNSKKEVESEETEIMFTTQDANC